MASTLGGEGSAPKSTPTSRPKAQPLSQDQESQLLALLVNSPLDRVSIGGCILWINPDLRYHTERNYNEQATLGTFGYYDWGVLPYEFTLTGTTGISGINNLETDKNSIGTVRPTFSVGPTELDFRYPARFKGSRKVRVLMIEDTYTKDNKFFWYSITLKQYPPSKTSYSLLSTTTAQTPAQAGRPAVFGGALVT